MLCRKCHKEIPDGSRYCCWCGIPQAAVGRYRLHHEGSVYKDSRSQHWVAQIYLTTIDGKRRAKRKYGFATRRDALEGLKQLQMKYSSELILSSGDVKLPTFTYFWQEYSTGDMLKISVNRQNIYQKAWERLEILHDKDIREVTTAGLQHTIDAVNPKGQYYSARDMKNLLSKLYQLAMSYNIVSNNLAKFIQLPELHEQSHDSFTLEEVNQLWESFRKGNTFTGYILLMIYTGMMTGELLGCRKDNIDWEHKKIVGAGKKTRKRKESPILFGEEMELVLQKLVEYSGASKKLVAMNKDRFYEQYYQTLEQCHIRKLSPYSCRHTTATVLADLKTPVPVIRGIMRHTKITTTQRYIHTSDESLRKAVDNMELQVGSNLNNSEGN